jgi:hypothetical protein
VRRWSGRIRAAVDVEADRVLDLVEAFDVLGFTTQVDRSGGCWQVELRRGEAPDAAVLREVVSVLERACTVTRRAEIVVETGDRSYRLPLRGAGE